MTNIYTIGFTKKSAQTFFELIKTNNITMVIDVRLNNTSQLASFAKYPDIVYFLEQICDCKYKSDLLFSPEESTLRDYKNKVINWNDYVKQFAKTLFNRKIEEYIEENYSEIIKNEKICFLCSEDTPENCHRRLIAEIFAQIFDCKIVHLF